jgi:hypothetical protein
MTSTINMCKQCERELEWQVGGYYCAACAISYKKLSYCPDCSAEIETLQACGATNYFCNQCHSLKSKSRVKHEFEQI